MQLECLAGNRGYGADGAAAAHWYLPEPFEIRDSMLHQQHHLIICCSAAAAAVERSKYINSSTAVQKRTPCASLPQNYRLSATEDSTRRIDKQYKRVVVLGW